MPKVLSALESVAASQSVHSCGFDCNYVLYHIKYMYTDLQVLMCFRSC